MLILRFFALAVPLLFFRLDAAQAQAIMEVESRSMTFVLLDTSSICTDCSVVQASGNIVEETLNAYNDLIWRQPFKQRIYFIFDSPGGSRKEAMQLGNLLRNLDAHTIIGRAIVRDDQVQIEPGRCASACVYAFFGGATRSIPKTSQLGVHSWAPAILIEEKERYSKPLDLDGLARIHQDTAAYLKYLDAMGIDLRLAVPTLRTPSRNITWINPDDQKSWNLVTIDSSLSTPAGQTSPVLLLSPQKGAKSPQRSHKR